MELSVLFHETTLTVETSKIHGIVPINETFPIHGRVLHHQTTLTNGISQINGTFLFDEKTLSNGTSEFNGTFWLNRPVLFHGTTLTNEIKENPDMKEHVITILIKYIKPNHILSGHILPTILPMYFI